MKSVVLLDISRLIWRARRPGPTGIDRVELAYAQHFVAEQDERPVFTVLHLFGWVIAFKPRGGRGFLAELSARWGEFSRTRRGANLRALFKMYWHLVSGGWLIGSALRRALRTSPAKPIFLVVSHHHLARAFAIARLRRTLGVKTVCLVHDLIPLEFPEYFKPGWEARYRRLASNIGRLFDAVIANSESTAHSLRAFVPIEPGRPAASIRTAPLGVRAFPSAGLVSHTAGERPYFVVLGTIEPRKNHLLLLNLWTRLASASPQAPRLLVVGTRGWENEQVLDMLERSSRLRGLVVELGGLSDAEVGALLRGARALLLPSLAEGFGLPLAECLASRIPAICSDIGVFREVGRDVPEYLDPLDLRAWSDAVLDYSRQDSARRAAQMQRLEQWCAPRWADHFDVVEQLLGELDASGAASPAAAPLPVALAEHR